MKVVKYFVLLIVLELVYRYIYFHSKLSEVQIEVLYFVPYYILLILILSVSYRRNINKREEYFEKTILYSLYIYYILLIIMNLYGLKFDNYVEFRKYLNNELLNIVCWSVISIYLLYKILLKCRKF